MEVEDKIGSCLLTRLDEFRRDTLADRRQSPLAPLPPTCLPDNLIGMHSYAKRFHGWATIVGLHKAHQLVSVGANAGLIANVAGAADAVARPTPWPQKRMCKQCLLMHY